MSMLRACALLKLLLLILCDTINRLGYSSLAPEIWSLTCVFHMPGLQDHTSISMGLHLQNMQHTSAHHMKSSSSLVPSPFLSVSLFLKEGKGKSIIIIDHYQRQTPCRKKEMSAATCSRNIVCVETDMCKSHRSSAVAVCKCLLCGPAVRLNIILIPEQAK